MQTITQPAATWILYTERGEIIATAADADYGEIAEHYRSLCARELDVLLSHVDDLDDPAPFGSQWLGASAVELDGPVARPVHQS